MSAGTEAAVDVGNGVQEAIWAEEKISPVVIGERLYHLQDHVFAIRIGPVGVILANREPRDHGTPGVRRCVVDEEEAMHGIVGIEGQP